MNKGKDNTIHTPATTTTPPLPTPTLTTTTTVTTTIATTSTVDHKAFQPTRRTFNLQGVDPSHRCGSTVRVSISQRRALCQKGRYQYSNAREVQVQLGQPNGSLSIGDEQKGWHIFRSGTTLVLRIGWRSRLALVCWRSKPTK